MKDLARGVLVLFATIAAFSFFFSGCSGSMAMSGACSPKLAKKIEKLFLELAKEA